MGRERRDEGGGVEGRIRLWVKVTERVSLILKMGLGDFLWDRRLIQRWVVACELVVLG
jgi:hypothetical protein